MNIKGEARTAENVGTGAENEALREIVADFIAIWEGPREYAAVKFAAAIVRARKLLEPQS